MTSTPLVPPLPLAAGALAPQPRPDGTPDILSGPDHDWDALAAARTRTLDALAGFEKMAELAEPDFRPTVARFLDLHRRHGDELTRLMSDAGHPPQDNGSLMGSVNRLVVATRALFDDIDADILARIRSGEDHVLAAYDTALEARLPAAVASRLAVLRDELRQLLAATCPGT